MRFAVVLSLVLSFGAGRANGQPRPSAGQRLYEEHCALCHGIHGWDGVYGSNLAVPRLPHAPDDESLVRLIKSGFPGTDMPPAYGVTDDDIRQIVTYVRGLGRSSVQLVSGDRARGEQIFRSKGNCGQCHMVRGQGGRQGPDLSDIGVRRSTYHMRQSLVEPEGDLPLGFVLVEITTREGRKISGVRLNEDIFSIQVRDLTDNLHSIWKTDIADLRKQWGKSPMPTYRATLTATEIDDLVAYLASLRGGS